MRIPEQTAVVVVREDGKSKLIAEFAGDHRAEHIAALKEIRDAGGKIGKQQFRDGFVLGTKGVVKRFRFNPNLPDAKDSPPPPPITPRQERKAADARRNAKVNAERHAAETKRNQRNVTLTRRQRAKRDKAEVDKAKRDKVAKAKAAAKQVEKTET